MNTDELYSGIANSRELTVELYLQGKSKVNLSAFINRSVS